MASLDLAHGLGFVWVMHLSDGHVGQLDPPEDTLDRITSYEDAVEETGRPGNYPVIVTETTHPSSIITPGLAACMSPRLRQKLDAQAKKRLNPKTNPLDIVEPFGFFEATQADRERPMIEGDNELVLGSGIAQPVGLPSIAATIVHNAARLTLACKALELRETSEVLQDHQIRTNLRALARRVYRGRYDSIIPLQTKEAAERELRTVLCKSDYVVIRTLSRLTVHDEARWKISLCFEKEDQRELVCGAIFEPRGLDSAFTDPVHRYYLAWSAEIQPVLDRLDKVVSEIYGESSSGAVIERLRREQADGIFRESRKTTPLLGRLVDICRMWNDTIAGYKVQKMLFADGLERC